jgi:hypothetical protein
MARGEVTVRTARGPRLSVTALMGENGPTMIGGYGGWEVVDRPRRIGLTQWRGRSPYSMTLDLVLDGFKQGDEVEIDISRLERMALPDVKEPPVVEVKGSAVPHDDLEWIIETLEFGTALRKNNGRRVRQEVTITFLRYVRIDRIQLSAAKKTRDKAGKK